MNKTPRQSFHSIITSPGFLLALILLLLNDHLLKQIFPGIITGKLSDFSGLFVVGLLVLGWRRIPPLISLTTITLLFIWWKSPLSGQFIVMWSELGLPPLQRVIDYTDLVALISLPLAHRYWLHHRELSINRLLRIPIIVTTAFAIGATSMPLYSISMEVPNPEPLDSTLSSNNSSICDAQLLRDIDRIVRNQGYKMTDDSDTGCPYKPSNETTQEEYYRYYLKDASELYLFYNKTSHVASISVQGISAFRDQSETLRRNLRDALMQHGYPLQVGEKIIRQQPSTHIRIVIKPAEHGDPLYPSHSYDLLHLPQRIESQLLNTGFRPVGDQGCGNDAYHGRERICQQYLAEDKESDLSTTTVTLTAYLLDGQPPMEISIVQFGNSNNISAESVARNLQTVMERNYPELTIEVIDATGSP